MIIKSNMPPAFIACLEALAFERGVSRSALIYSILSEAIKNDTPRLSKLREDIRDIEKEYRVLPGVAADAYFTPPLPPTTEEIEAEFNKQQAKKNADALEEMQRNEAAKANKPRPRKAVSDEPPQPAFSYLLELMPRLEEIHGKWKTAAELLNKFHPRGDGEPWDGRQVSSFYRARLAKMKS
ncbi:hypothetical protein EDF88_5014 [Buttiauxella sp. BIGb0552]|uniref:hypothetical protein n=1 Tax=Buttiauxella sp. BIGb0552 TaxID=2485120 RepID=UPI001065E4D7|nr:hypothetical protein [Buttiauxella sp. BIGb0552]TDX09599.1 hypothetical protein EDF88_5014 [Buttiauxella sp. BIGb0552]